MTRFHRILLLPLLLHIFLFLSHLIRFPDAEAMLEHRQNLVDGQPFCWLAMICFAHGRTRFRITEQDEDVAKDNESEEKSICSRWS